jgi:hypothetical protein
MTEDYSEIEDRLYSQACFNICQQCGSDWEAPASCEECLTPPDPEDELAKWDYDMMNTLREEEYQRLKKELVKNPEKLEEILTHY